MALGLHGTRESLMELVEVFRDEDASLIHRAVALEALQLLLGHGQGFHLSGLLRQANFAIFTPPLARHRYTLL
jgi:hypothetical protein